MVGQRVRAATGEVAVIVDAAIGRFDGNLWARDLRQLYITTGAGYRDAAVLHIIQRDAGVQSLYLHRAVADVRDGHVAGVRVDGHVALQVFDLDRAILRIDVDAGIGR